MEELLEKIGFQGKSFFRFDSQNKISADTFFASLSSNIDSITLDEIINILDVTILVNELHYSSNLYCIYVYGDFDYNQELNILDIVQLVNIILN